MDTTTKPNALLIEDYFPSYDGDEFKSFQEKFTWTIDQVQKDTSHITKLEFAMVDRGISDFIAFAHCIVERFPALEKLKWRQNYSYSDSFSDNRDIVSGFYALIDILFVQHNVRKLRLFDWQSDWIAKIDAQRIFEMVPAGSDVYIESEWKPGKETFLEDKQLNKAVEIVFNNQE